jgi:hypothetical protein
LGGSRANREPGSSIACVRTWSRGGSGADQVTGLSVAVATEPTNPRGTRQATFVITFTILVGEDHWVLLTPASSAASRAQPQDRLTPLPPWP